MKTIAIVNDATDVVVGDCIEYAATALRRMVGLLGKKTLPPGGGIWIVPSSGIHTFGMKFPIDVIGLDRWMRVVRLWRNIRPQRVTCIDLRVASVIELAAGEIEARAVRLGDTLVSRQSPPVFA